MKKFHVTKNYALINFDSTNLHGQADILNSKGFENVLKAYVNVLKKKDDDLINLLKEIDIKDLIHLYKLLLVYDTNEAFKKVKSINIRSRFNLYTFTEGFYDYWRNLARFGFLKSSKTYDPNNRVDDLINQANSFNDKVITLYRTISQKLLTENFHVYRQLPAGVNASMIYIRHKFSNNVDYENIQNIPFVTKIVTNPPFIIKSKSNTRKHLFSKINDNPLNKLDINKSHYIAFPIYIGSLLAFVYIHRDFIHQGIALSNLFEFADYKVFKTKSPDLVFVYGINEEKYDYKYYIDKTNNIHIGFVSRKNENDYFGYLKKMLLTLHNVYKINKGDLPIHGAMVQIKLNDGTKKNVCVVGDSGAGKSETLEALRVIGDKNIKKMDIVFDDMGTFSLNEKGKVVANGTETGAFVRLDDLDTGYAYEIMDRALFLNPNQINARVVIPISSHYFITSNHKIDMFLYANNYDQENEGIKEFNSLEEAISIFKRGRRKAKGTTSEVGLVESYFANPFGPHQMQEECDVLIDKYFKALKSENVFMGEIYTKLAINGYETKGPKEAASILLKYLKKA